MKFQKFEALEKHLSQAHPEHLSNIYLISSPYENERSRLLFYVAEQIAKKWSNPLLKKGAGLKEVVDFVWVPSLFGERLIGIAEVAKENMALFASYARSVSLTSHLVLGVESNQLAVEFYQVAMREIVLLDLSGETPGSRKRRLVDWTLRCFKAEGKKITPPLAEGFVERCELDFGLLEQEMQKIFCFVGEREEIQEEDFQAISTNSSTQINNFQLAESLIEGNFCHSYRIHDLSHLFLLIGSCRYLFEEGLKGSSQIEKGRKATSKQARLLYHRKSPFFQKGLNALFELELRAKLGLANPQILFDRFCAHILGS